MLRTISTIAVLCIAVAGASEARAQSSNAAAPEQADAGEHLFKQYCSACHSLEQDQKLVGPSLYHELKAPHPKQTPAGVRAMVANGKGTMPSFKNQLAPPEVEEIIVYLRKH